MSVRTRIVLGTLCTFNGLILVGLGAVAWTFVDGTAGPAGAALFWVAAGFLFVGARRLKKSTDW